MEPTGRVMSVHGATIKGETAAAESFSVGSYISIPLHDAENNRRGNFPGVSSRTRMIIVFFRKSVWEIQEWEI